MKINNNRPFVSVIVCTHNRGDKLVTCLTALLNQTYNRYEIIVVNDNSTDSTKQILTEFNGIKIISNKHNLGLSASRNVGVKHSRGDILAFTDDDCIADKNWIKYLILPYSNSKIAGAGGSTIPNRTDSWLLKYYEINNPLTHLSYKLNKSSGLIYRFILYIKRTISLNQLSLKPQRLYSLIGANMSMRKKTFDLIKGFDENIKFAGDEQYFWNRLRVANPNYELYFAPNAIIKHDYEDSFIDALRRNYSYGRGAANQYFKYRNIIPVIFPFPIIIISCLLFSIINPNYAILSLILTILLYPGWIWESFKNADLSYLTYSFVQGILELTLTLGFISGLQNYSKFKLIRL
jgi:glycosyltransferase involved in cell wall biosynthesis